MGHAQLAFFISKGYVENLDSLKRSLQSFAMFVACTMKHQIIFDFLGAFQSFYKTSYAFMTFIAATGSAYYYYCVKSEQFVNQDFPHLCQADGLNGCSPLMKNWSKKVVLQLLWGGNWEVWGIHCICSWSSIYVYTNLFISPVFVSDKHIANLSSCWLWIKVTHRPFPLSAALQCVLCKVVFIGGQWACDFVASASPLGLLLYLLALQWLVSGSENMVDFFLLTLSWRCQSPVSNHLI